jgi:hypothetical protein
MKNSDKQMYFEQYKLFVESAENVSGKRMSANNYFLTINTALISMAGLLFSSKLLISSFNAVQMISVLGLTICVIWFFIVLSYKQLNSGKFKVIHRIEKKLPIKLYADEWEVLGKGKDIKKYIPLSHVELAVPFVFFCLYLVLVFCRT